MLYDCVLFMFHGSTVHEHTLQPRIHMFAIDCVPSLVLKYSVLWCWPIDAMSCNFLSKHGSHTEGKARTLLHIIIPHAGFNLHTRNASYGGSTRYHDYQAHLRQTHSSRFQVALTAMQCSRPSIRVVQLVYT